MSAGATDRRPGWGIVGTGWVAQTFTRDLVTHGHRVVAVGSRSPETASSFAKQFDLSVGHGSYQALVNDPEVDIVYVGTPHVFHAANARLALEAGKHVLVEKPFTLNAQEAADIVALASRKGLVIMEAMWTRFLPHMLKLREYIVEKAIGDLLHVSADHVQVLTTDPKHRMNALELGGGALLDLGVYPISFARELLGPPRVIRAHARKSSTGVDAGVAVIMEHVSGALSSSLSALDTPGLSRATIIGTAGWIEIDDMWYCPSNFRVYSKKNQIIAEYRSDVPARGMQLQASEMERLVAEHRSSQIMPPAQSIEIMLILDEVRRQIGLVYPQERASGGA